MPKSKQKKQEPAFNPSQEYLAREKRINDAMNLRKPDRVPVIPLYLNYYPTRTLGISNKDAIINSDRTLKIIAETTVKHNWDAFTGPLGMLIEEYPLQLLGISQIKFPGVELPEEKPYKWVEDEYMMQDEYDEFIDDPNGFVVKKLWPRIAKTLAPVSQSIQDKPFSFLYGANAFTLPFLVGEFLSSEGMIQSLKNFIALAEYHQKSKIKIISYIDEIKKLGYPSHTTGMVYPAFDWISTNLRGLRGALIDMYQVPDKLISALKILTPHIIKNAIMDAHIRGDCKRVIVRMHHGVAEFMENDQYMKFYWPYLKDLLIHLIDAGLMPIPVFEGDSTPVLNLLKELPPGKVTVHFDKVDRKKAKKILGDVMCFWGNVPEKLLCEGTVQQVKDDAKELIDTFGDNGGIIIDGAMGIPARAKPENVQALTDAVHEYGVY